MVKTPICFKVLRLPRKNVLHAPGCDKMTILDHGAAPATKSLRFQMLHSSCCCSRQNSPRYKLRQRRAYCVTALRVRLYTSVFPGLVSKNNVWSLDLRGNHSGTSASCAPELVSLMMWKLEADGALCLKLFWINKWWF